MFCVDASGLLIERGSNLSLYPGVRHVGVSFLAKALLVGVFFSFAAALTHAQDPAEDTAGEGNTQVPHAATITVNARLVVLDIVVTGKDGKPVDGLTRKDFEVFEDDKLQSIRSFESPSAHSLPAASTAAGAAMVYDAAKPAAFGQSPVTVLVLDQLNTHFADSSFARRSLHDYLTKQPQPLSQPATLLTVYQNKFKLLKEFTRDRDALLKALEAAPTEYAWQLEVNGSADYGPLERLDQSLHAIEEIAQSYARIPGRKNLIWVGSGFPTIDPTTIDGDNAQELKDTMQHVTDVLLDTRITLYGVDPTSSAAGLTEVITPEQIEFAQDSAEGLSTNFDPYDSNEGFDRLGPVTGGRVIRGMNDIAQQIATSVNLGSDFYTIGYSPSSSSEAKKPYRKIRVVCLRPGLTAVTRAGYYPERTQQQEASATAAYDLGTAAESSIPLNGLRVTVEPDTAPNAPSDTYVVRVGASDLTWHPGNDGASVASVYIMSVSLNEKNKMLSHTLRGMTASAKAGVDLRDPSRQAGFVFTVRPSSKAASLRFIARDSGTGRMGAVDIPVKRPSPNR